MYQKSETLQSFQKWERMTEDNFWWWWHKTPQHIYQKLKLYELHYRKIMNFKYYISPSLGRRVLQIHA